MEVPHGDILVHAEDFTNVGLVRQFKEFLAKLPHKHKVKELHNTRNLYLCLFSRWSLLVIMI